MTINPAITAAAAGTAGACTAVAGVFVLAGPGWALVVASLPMLALCAVLTRGLIRG